MLIEISLEGMYLGYELTLLESSIHQRDFSIPVKLGTSHLQLVCRLDYTSQGGSSARVIEKAW